MIVDLMDFITNMVFPVLVAIITYYFISKRDELKKRKGISCLGSAVMDSLLEEVRNGVKIFKTISENENFPKQILPRKSWYGIQTISDELLLRIIEVSKNVDPDGFPINEIRIHCKNYFDHMTYNLDNCYTLDEENWRKCARNLAVDSRYLEAAEGVQRMLEQVKQLLENNSNKLFPK